MSWSLNKAGNAAEVAAKVRKASENPHGIPVALAEAAAQMIEGLGPEKNVSVTSNGHVDQNTAGCTLTISTEY